MNFYQTQSHLFLVFIAIAAMSFAALPSLLGAFSDVSDVFVIENMKRVQVEMYFYEIDNGNFTYACIGGEFIILQNKILLESGRGLSCTMNKNNTSLSLYTKLRSGDIYCVDSLGNSGFVDDDIRYMGRCSK